MRAFEISYPTVSLRGACSLLWNRGLVWIVVDMSGLHGAMVMSFPTAVRELV